MCQVGQYPQDSHPSTTARAWSDFMRERHERRSRADSVLARKEQRRKGEKRKKGKKEKRERRKKGKKERENKRK